MRFLAFAKIPLFRKEKWREPLHPPPPTNQDFYQPTKYGFLQFRTSFKIISYLSILLSRFILILLCTCFSPQIRVSCPVLTRSLLNWFPIPVTSLPSTKQDYRMAAPPKGKGFMAKGPNTIDQRFAERLFKHSQER